MDSQASIQCGGPSQSANRPDRRSVAGSVPMCGFLLLLLMPLMSSGCMTAALWSSTDPDERVWVSASETTEEKLNEKGLSYTRYRFKGEQLREYGIACEGEVVDGYLVEKTELQKFGDTMWRIAATPVTLALDACGCVLVALLSDPDAMRGLVECASTCAFN